MGVSGLTFGQFFVNVFVHIFLLGDCYIRVFLHLQFYGFFLVTL